LRQFKSLRTGETEPFLERLGEVTGSGRCPAEVAEGIWMTWEMVREMDRTGMDIGGHTVTHPVLANAPAEVQRYEILESKRRIEAELGHSITAFSYPVGQRDSFTPRTQEFLREAGYQWAFSFFGGFAPKPQFDCYNLPRVAVSPHVSPALFRSTARHPWLFA
jgi:peptidoglycan/xylan/chitin deacetylase (PgdA/CDA1 family)